MSKPLKFRPEPYSQGPHAHAVHDAGGKLIGVPMPPRERWLADLAAHAPGCDSPVDSVGCFPAEGIRCGQTGPDGQPVLCPHCRVTESADLDHTASYPDDFQVILLDFLAPLGFDDLPAQVPVKWVAAGPYRQQARTWEYHCSDQRSNPDYLGDMSQHLRAGGELPPIIVCGSKLIDGRHRLLADPRATVKAIDMLDFKRMTGAENSGRAIQ